MSAPSRANVAAAASCARAEAGISPGSWRSNSSSTCRGTASAIPRSPSLQERRHALGDSQRLAARAIVHRGIDRGELPPGTSVTLLLDTLCGGAMFHALTVLPGTRETALRDSAAYARRLADFVLDAARNAD